MISRNSDLSDKTIRTPFLLNPVGKDYLWGGSRLNDDFSKGIDMFPLAETWECSTHQEGQSVISNGEFKNMLLSDLVAKKPEMLGDNCKNFSDLPILIKLIDAEKDLSIQVHPDDIYAKENENGSRGKAEMWYILDAKPKSSIVYGLNRDLSKAEFKKSIETGIIEKYVQRVSVNKNDVFYISPGTIHAIGAGVLVAEIQENSNLTYRIFDYNRTDKQGKKRKLQIKKATEVANLSSSSNPTQPMRVLNYQPGCAEELLCRCSYFKVYRMLINTERYRNLVKHSTGKLSFEVLLCTDGCGSISFETHSFNFFKGDCIFIPANSLEICIHAKAQFLRVSC